MAEYSKAPLFVDQMFVNPVAPVAPVAPAADLVPYLQDLYIKGEDALAADPCAIETIAPLVQPHLHHVGAAVLPYLQELYSKKSMMCKAKKAA